MHRMHGGKKRKSNSNLVEEWFVWEQIFSKILIEYLLQKPSLGWGEK